MTTTAQQLVGKPAREITHVINPDDDAVRALRIADAQLRSARLVGDLDAITAAQAAYDQAEEAVRSAALVLRLRALPRRGEGSYAVLKAEHPPTAEDNARIQETAGDPKAKAAWHSDSFYPALVAACLVQPQITLDQAEEMARTWNDPEWNSLRDAALEVNTEKTDTGGLVFS